MASTRLTLFQAFGDPPQAEVWNPGLDAEYVALGHIQADEFNRRLAAWNGWAIDGGSIRHIRILLDRHEPTCTAPPPQSATEEYDACGCDHFRLYPITDPHQHLPVHFHELRPGEQPPADDVVAVTYAFLDRDMAEAPGWRDADRSLTARPAASARSRTEQ